MVELPESLAEIADVIGRGAALRLACQLPTCFAGVNGHKGTRVILYVPKTLKPDHRLVEILGWDVAMKLANHFGGEILQPANCRAYFTAYRNAAVLEMLRAGTRPKVVAVMFGMCDRSVLDIAKANGKTTRGNSRK